MSGQIHTLAACRFTRGQRVPGTPYIGGWLSFRVGLDGMEKRKIMSLPGIELWASSLQVVAIRRSYPASDRTPALDLNCINHRIQSTFLSCGINFLFN